MDAQEVKRSEGLIQGICEVNGKILTVLYDLATSQFFVSRDCMSALQLPISELPYDLLVSTFTNKPIKTNHVCMNVSLRIGGRTFTANLICLPLSGLDIILGMDWLSANRVMLNCSDKTIIFPSVPPPEPMTPVNLYLSSLAVYHYGNRSQGYILLSTNMTEVDQKLDDIIVVREYPDVFPEDIPEFSP